MTGKAFLIKELEGSLGLKCLYRLELSAPKPVGPGALDDEDSFHESLPNFVVLSSVRCWWSPGPAGEDVEILILESDENGKHDMADLPGSTRISNIYEKFEDYHKETLRMAGYELVESK